MKPNLNNSKINVQLQKLDAYIWDIVSSGAISEYELIKTLQNPPYSVFKSESLQQPFDLYQTHFITYNSLYRLQQSGLFSNEYYLDINAINIEVLFSKDDSSSANSRDLSLGSLERNEKLANFYLDWRNLDTSEQQVEELLASFWKKYAAIADNDLSESLSILKLTELPNQRELKSQYRKLSNIYHPDKGGDQKEFHTLVTAYHKLNAIISD